MKQIFVFFSAVALALSFSFSASAAEPDKPGTTLITIQGGYGPGIGAIVSGNIAMANLGAAHLYGGLQLGANMRHGSVTGTQKIDLSAAPRLMLGFNLGRAVEFHFGGLAGVAAQRFDSNDSKLSFCYGGFGGFRFNVSDSFALVAEGYYSPMLPYGSAGIAFRF